MTTADQSRDHPLHLRIFLASPGDVADERAVALNVLDRLQYDPGLVDRVRISSIAWDKAGVGTPMLATMTPQEAIKQGLPKPSECDIVIVIFWSRMGTPLPSEWKKTNGTPYLSGTEWEYEDALQGNKDNGRPDILVYRRTGKPTVELDPASDEFQEKCKQWQRVEAFFKAFENPDGSLCGGVNQYETPDDFARELEDHLRKLIYRLLETGAFDVDKSDATAPSPGPTLWKDSPFPGLRTFTPADAPIFFGRGRETDALIRKFADPANRFVAVVGASGSGKSSLVAAGLLPRLGDNAIPGGKDWVWLRFTPGEVGDNPFMALAIKAADALEKQGRKPREVAEALREDAVALEELVPLALDGKPEWAELLLFVDQFEELFTLVADEHRGPFVGLLARAAQTARVRVVVTVRADFYHRCVEQPELAALLGAGTYPLAAPQPWVLHEMILRPAERAGLVFEPGLDETILKDTGAEPGALALMAFALAELYQGRTREGQLTQAAYDRFKGVKGAIGQRAEETFVSLKADVKASLERVFRELVDVDEHGVATRRRAPLSGVAASAGAAALVEAFTGARLLVQGGDEVDEPTVEVAHEALLTSWPRLKRWIEANAEQLRARRDLERAAREWRETGRPKWSGLASGKILKRYRRVKPGPGLERDYLRACGWRAFAGYVIAGVTGIVFLGGAAFFSWIAEKRMSPWVGIHVLLDRPISPEMVSIASGSFLMGSPESDEDALSDERPQHRVRVEAFHIGKYEVTFNEYDIFAHSTGRIIPDDQDWGRGRRPVINVSWEDAVAYAAWLSERTDERYRLPTEAEWEYAARAGTQTRYWWGDEFNQEGKVWANCLDCGSDWDGKQTAPAGSFEANYFGLHDTAGNVWEWTCSPYEERYGGLEMECYESNKHAMAGRRVLRGGSWGNVPARVRSAYRGNGTPGSRHDIIGFRLAQDL